MANPSSRLNQARAAIRPEMKGRVMLSGPPGAGKTYTSLLIARALVGPEGRILVIDSEKESALTYADLFQFEHLRWNPPYDPTSLALTWKEAQGEFDACITDSFSHWWRKQGGVLDIAGDDVRGWKVARPVQEDLIGTLLDVDMHMIVCARSKMDHLVEQENGRMKVTKVGLKAQQDDDLEYEVNVALEMDMAHVLSVVKSRTNDVPVGSQFLAGYAGDFAMNYRDWLLSGEPVAAKEDTEALAVGLGRIADEVERKRAKYEFLNSFGRPEFLLVSRLEEAQAWVADRILGIAPPVDRAEDEVPKEPEGVTGEAAPTSAAGSGEGHQVGNSAQAGDVASLTPGNSGAAPTPDPVPAEPPAAPEEAIPPGTAAVQDGDGSAPPVGAVVPSGAGVVTEPVELPPDGDPGGDPPPLPDDSAVVVSREAAPPPAPGQAAGHPSSTPVPSKAEIEAQVAGMVLNDIKAKLEEAKLAVTGTAPQLRKRLVAHILEQPF